MPRVKAGPVNAERLLSFVQRIEKLEEERQAIGGDVREVYGEVKAAGYDVKTMRKVVAERKQDAADRAEQETLLDVYRRALGMASYRDVAERFGISKSKLHRLVPRENSGTAKTAHNPETGEIAETAVNYGTAGDGTGTVVGHDQAPAVASNAGEGNEVDAPVDAGAKREGSHEVGATDEPEVARVVPPATIQESCGSRESRPAEDRPRGREQAGQPVGTVEASGSPQGSLNDVDETDNSAPIAGVAPGPQDPDGIGKDDVGLTDAIEPVIEAEGNHTPMQAGRHYTSPGAGDRITPPDDIGLIPGFLDRAVRAQ